MFVLDTNVLSAIMGAEPVPAVARWIAAQVEALLYTTAVSKAEILAGVGVLPEGRRRHTLVVAANAIFASGFERRVLPFDETAAELYAELFAARKRAGKPTSTMALMIASVARARGAAMVTRDIGGFEHCGLRLINPWDVRRPV